MSKKKLTLFANFFIDTPERFQRMKDSLESMRGIVFDYHVVNVRGKFSNQVKDFLLCSLNNLHITTTETENGWFYDTLGLVGLIKTKYVFLWVEDHICIDPEYANAVVDAMDKCGADILTYSFWCNGEFSKRYEAVSQVDCGVITWFDHDKNNNELIINSRYGGSYLISYVSIMKNELFKKIIEDGGSERRWSIMTPFDFEKAPVDIRWLPLKRANPKKEIFASIDDDHGVVGSCLIARGMYEKREYRHSYARSSIKNKLFATVKSLFARVK